MENIDEIAFMVGEAILKERKAIKMTQKEFAEMIGLNSKQLDEIERGITLPEFITMIELSNFIDFKWNELIDRITKTFNI